MVTRTDRERHAQPTDALEAPRSSSEPADEAAVEALSRGGRRGRDGRGGRGRRREAEARRSRRRSRRGTVRGRATTRPPRRCSSKGSPTPSTIEPSGRPSPTRCWRGRRRGRRDRGGRRRGRRGTGRRGRRGRGRRRGGRGRDRPRPSTWRWRPPKVTANSPIDLEARRRPEATVEPSPSPPSRPNRAEPASDDPSRPRRLVRRAHLRRATRTR